MNKPLGRAAHPNALRSELDLALPAWILVDPILGEPLGFALDPEASRSELRALRERQWQRSVSLIELSTEIDLPKHLQPYLVELDDRDDPWIAESLALALEERASARARGLAGTGRAALRIGGWIRGNLDAADVAAHLATMARLRPPTGMTSARYLRVADPQTLDLLHGIFGADELAGAIGPLRQWIWLDACGRLERIEAHDAATTRPIEFDVRAWRLFAASHLVQPALARWLGQLEQDGVIYEGSLDEALRRCHAAVEQAKLASRRDRRLFVGDDDLIAWAALSLARPGFEADERWRAVLEAHAMGGTFNDMCYAYPGHAPSSAEATS